MSLPRRVPMRIQWFYCQPIYENSRFDTRVALGSAPARRQTQPTARSPRPTSRVSSAHTGQAPPIRTSVRVSQMGGDEVHDRPYMRHRNTKPNLIFGGAGSRRWYVWGWPFPRVKLLHNSASDAVAITISLVVIGMILELIGCMLPRGIYWCRIDPAHAIQVRGAPVPHTTRVRQSKC
jgi:hypothetical protein